MKNKFIKNDVVRSYRHNNLLIVHYYDIVQAIGDSKPELKVRVTEGDYYKEEELTLVYRENPLTIKQKRNK